MKAYAEAAALDRLTLSAGDQVAQLRGKRLDEVAKAHQLLEDRSVTGRIILFP